MPASPIPVRPGASGVPGTSATFPGDACPGALRLHAADDGFLARVRVPGGVLDVDRARALGDAARRLGDGALHLTSRGNVQLRGLRDGCGGELAAVLGAAGLLPSAAHERVRNVVASPMSGLDGLGCVDVRAWLTGLDAAVLASSVTPELSGRFLFGLDDGRGDVAGLRPDVLLRGRADGSALLVVGGAEFVVRYEDAARAAVIAAEVFVGAARVVSDRRVWRVSELGASGAELGAWIAERLSASGIEAGPARGAGNCAPGHDASVRADETATGADAKATGLRPGPRCLSYKGGTEFSGPSAPTPGGAEFSGPSAPAPGGAGMYGPSASAGNPAGGGPALQVIPRFGSLTGDQWTALTDLAAELPARELRLTPWRRVVVPGATSRQAPAGLITDPDSPWSRLGACIGRPGCAKSRTDVRADATAQYTPHPTLPTYWSGCERRCGHPVGPYVDVVARPDGTYDVTTLTTERAEPRV
ncbi:cobalamin biosynthesis protein CobG [Streptomyces sp. NPDC046939]|uniref:cobalamin biosynthesis protein CobG n=1 Tax=Streptomyces sp. NPDC046939 TaxID=3155376 RepID=UPI0033DC2BCC